MPFAPEGPSLDPKSIKIDRANRVRREIIITGPHTDNLLESIKERGGLIHPIIVKRTEPPELVAGERRLTCYLKLGWPLIPVRYLDTLDLIEVLEIEFEENAKRTDVSWVENTQAIHRIHSAYRVRDPDWTAAETAVKLGLTRGATSEALRVAVEIEQSPGLAQALTMREAYNRLLRREQRASVDAYEELIGGVNEIAPMVDLPKEMGDLQVGKAEPKINRIAEAERSILQESFLDWAPKYKGHKFNFVHCDFPYGISFNSGPQSGVTRDTTYDDSSDVYFKLLECFCVHLDKFMASNAHLVFWFSAKKRRETEDMFAKLAPSLTFYPYDLIWLKSDNAGIAADHKRNPRHIYESAMFAYRGGRNIVEIRGDAFAAPTDKKWHPSTKPVPMLKYFFAMLVDQSTSIFDPTCGSGSALRAAEDMGAVRVLGLESDAEHCMNARNVLRQERTLRAVSREI